MHGFKRYLREALVLAEQMLGSWNPDDEETERYREKFRLLRKEVRKLSLPKRVLVVTDEGLATPLVFSTLEAFLQYDFKEDWFTKDDKDQDYFLMLSELEKPDGCWADKTGSVMWIEVQT